MRTLDVYINAYVSERRRRGEIAVSTAVDLRSRLYSLSESFGARSINRLTEAAIYRWLGTIGHMRQSSKRAYLSTVREFSRWMVRRGHIGQNPTVEIDRIKEPRSVPRALPAAKVERLLVSQPGLRAQAILWLMVGIGLRCSEVASLEVDDYDTLARTVFIIGKGSHERLVPVPANVEHALTLYLDETGWLSGPLIRSELDPTRGVKGSTLSKLVAAWMTECGIKRRPRDGISAHALRHTCLSDVADICKGDMRVVMAIGGHASLSSASTYQRAIALPTMRDALEGRSYRAA